MRARGPLEEIQKAGRWLVKRRFLEEPPQDFSLPLALGLRRRFLDEDRFSTVLREGWGFRPGEIEQMVPCSLPKCM